jgi:hypothetical protein
LSFRSEAEESAVSPQQPEHLSSPQTIKTRANPADSRGVSVTLQPLYWIEN